MNLNRGAAIAVLLFLLAISPVGKAEDGPELSPPTPNCWQNNPNWHTVRTMSVTSEQTVCVYGAAAVLPCQMTSPRGLPLKRAVIKPDGRVKCVYGGAGQ